MASALSASIAPSWLLFYSSLFETRNLPSQAVMDPGGVVQSQVIESGVTPEQAIDGEGLWLVLNGSQSHRTQSARFVTDFFGSGVQHIAFATKAIRSTVRRLLGNGLILLPIPSNYYDDLKARADLTEEAIAELEALNVLYDHDAHGTFFQAYTRTLDGGFLFEIIQRDGYQGYGAANAGIRLTAQMRLARPSSVPGV